MAGETRQKILEATERLIKMKGLARVTTKEIAREVGLSEGALYRHFEHKEEMFFAIALAGMEYFGELIPMSASFLADTELLAQYRQKMSQVTAGPNGGGPQHIENLMAIYLDEERQLGRFHSPIASRELAILLLGACFQYTYLYQLMGNPPFGRERKQFVRELVRGILDSSQPS
jgi:AcrR family transcriptional regulator